MSINGIIPIKDPERSRSMRALLEDILNKHPLIDSIYTLNLPKQSILYPITYRLNKLQFSALRNATQIIGEKECYLSILQNYKHDRNIDKDWVINLNSDGYLLFAKSNMVLENILYSVNGSWAIIFHTDDLAIIGGKEEFIKSFLEAFPLTEGEQIKNYLDDCKYYAERMGGFDFDGLLIFLERIFGREKAPTLLQASNITKP